MKFFESGVYSLAGCPLCHKYLQLKFKVGDNIIYFCHNCKLEVIFNEKK